MKSNLQMINRVEKVTKYTTETYQMDFDIVLEIKKENNRLKSSCMKLGNRVLGLVTKEFFDFIKMKNPFHNYEEFYKIKNQLVVETKSILNLDSINYNNIVEIRIADHSIRNLQEVPYSIVQHDNLYPYTNKYYDLGKLLEHLKNHPYIINKDDLEIESIPYYNSEEDEDKFIDPYILLPQDVSDLVWIKSGFDISNYYYLILNLRKTELDLLNSNQFKIK